MKGVNYLRTYGQRAGANVGPSPTCTYIEGDRPYTLESYCGQPSVDGKSWCNKHFHTVFRPWDNGLQRDFERGVIKVSRISK